MTPEERLRDEKMRAGWKYRAVDATQGDLILRPLLLTILNKPALNPPWIGPQGAITKEGVVICDFVDADNHKTELLRLCAISDLVDNFRRLADHLALTDAEREEMFSALRKWIVVDHRADPDWTRLRREALLH